MFLGKGKEGRLEGGRGVLSKVRVCIDVGLIRGIVPLELFSNCWGGERPCWSGGYAVGCGLFSIGVGSIALDDGLSGVDILGHAEWRSAHSCRGGRWWH